MNMEAIKNQKVQKIKQKLIVKKLLSVFLNKNKKLSKKYSN